MFYQAIGSSIQANKDKIEKYGYLGLVLFVGVPLPGTGAWTGCLIASLLDMEIIPFSVVVGAVSRLNIHMIHSRIKSAK